MGAAVSEEPAVVRPERRHDSSGFERDGADDVCSRSALANVSAIVGSLAIGGAGYGPERVDGRCQVRPLVTRKSRVGRFCAGFPVPRWVRFCAADPVEPQSSASRVVCRCPEWPQAVSDRLKSGATLTNRSGEGASCCALRATSSKHGPRGPQADVWSGDESPREMK